MNVFNRWNETRYFGILLGTNVDEDYFYIFLHA